MSSIVTFHTQTKQKISDKLLNPIQKFLPKTLIEQFCRECNYRWRERDFAPAATLLACIFKHLRAHPISTRATEDYLQSLRSEANALAISVMPQRIPDRENAAILYEKAFDLPCYYYGRLPSKERIKEMNDIEANFLKDNFDPHTESVQRYASFFAGATAELKQATTLPDCYFEKEYSSPNMAMLMPELSKFRASLKILAIEALSCAARGDVSTALRNITTIQRMAQHQAQSPILISLLVAMSIDYIAKQTLERVLNSTQPKPGDFDTSPVWVSATYRRNFRRVMVEEQASMLNMMADVADGKTPFYDFEVAYRDSLFAPFYRVFQAERDVQRNREAFIGIKGLTADNGLLPIGKNKDMDNDFL